MDLNISKDPMSDEHTFKVSIRNVSKKDIEIEADYYFEEDAAAGCAKTHHEFVGIYDLS